MKSKILSLTMLVLIVTLALVACGDSDEHTHTWEAATCTTAKTCSECGIETGSVSTTNHNYGEWQTVKTVSCTENGIKKQTCSWCKNEKTETITATGHNYVDGVCKFVTEMSLPHSVILSSMTRAIITSGGLL